VYYFVGLSTSVTSLCEFADHRRMSSSDVNNKSSFTTVNNNPSSGVEFVPSSPVMRVSTGSTNDHSAPMSAAMSHRRSDFADYRGGSGGSSTGSTVVAAISSSFRSPKLESRAGAASAKKAQKTSHHSAVTLSAGKRRQKLIDVGAPASGGRSQPSDSVRHIGTCLLVTVVVNCCSR